jgi:hypothetical protein
VLVGLPHRVAGPAILFAFILVYFYNTHKVLIGLSQGVGDLVLYIFCFYYIIFYFVFIICTRCS